MSDQLSEENPVWELSPAEIKYAYLSLTLSKKEISELLGTDMRTVGSHLTAAYSKLNLSGYDDEVKRSLLDVSFQNL